MKEKMFQFFKDPQCREPIYNLEFPEPVVGGKKTEFTIYAKNITNAELYDIEFTPKDNDLKIEKSGDKANPSDTLMLRLTFAPSEDRREPLNTEIEITAKGIIRAKPQ